MKREHFSVLQVMCWCAPETNEALAGPVGINLLILFNPQSLVKYPESKAIPFVEVQCVQNSRAVSLDLMRTSLVLRSQRIPRVR